MRAGFEESMSRLSPRQKTNAMTTTEIEVFNKKHSPKTLLRMGWSYYDTESAARWVAQWADQQFHELLDLIESSDEQRYAKVHNKLVDLLK